MDKIIEFNKNDLFFEPVLCFYASWISFPFLYTPQGYPVDANIVIRGGWRGKIIPQLKYEDRNIYKNLQNLKPITKIKFFTDNTPAADSTGKSLNDAYLIEFLAQQMFGHAFEIATPQIKQKFGNNRKKEWPATIQFAYHIRNGCYHGNKFNILKNSLSESISTEWENKSIQYSDNGKKVSQGFMWPADFICLLYDLQNILKKIRR